ncbi:hypothetical protein [Desulfonema magnum]|uniref:Uncharacterized protein n=1 Tax=Desulfonema magnum TaxID=45655 RepID=A0A975C122_9BACT|nr:hypothetical protein [Desulfonema magnum]QTA93879.1 Uncharacterized protein dnm_099870 [Desulfonema magnum]
MNLYHNDFSDALVEEVLTDAACTFFGARKQMEEMIALFGSFVESLRENEAKVADRAGFLNYLLLGGHAARDFYKFLRVDSPDILLESQFSGAPLPTEIPFAFTKRGEFTKLVLGAYNDLQKVCDEYVNGKADETCCEKNIGKISVYYNLIVSMCDFINEKVRSMNCDMSPSSVLQFAKKFDPGAEKKACITGGMCFGGDECGINQRLAFQPVDLDSLDLKTYPELPKQDKVASEITLFCKTLYSCSKDEIKKRIFDLKEKIRMSPKA